MTQLAAPIVTDDSFDLLTGARNDKLAAQEETMEEQSPAFFSEVLPAAFRLNNEIVSAIVSESISHISDKYDKDYYAWDDLGEFANHPFANTLVGAKNAAHMQAMKNDFNREQEDNEILNRASGSTVASLTAAIASPLTLIPLGAIVNGARGISIAKTAVKTGAIGGATIAGSETVLQATQQSRSAETSAYAIAGGALLSGLLGAGASKMSKLEFDRLASKLERDLAVKDVEDLGEEAILKALEGDSVGAAHVKKLTDEELRIVGTGAQFVSRATRVVTPFNRLMNSPFKETRRIFTRMAEIPVQVGANAEGKSLGVAAETEIKLQQKGVAVSYKSINDSYMALKKSEESLGMKPMSFKVFKEEVANAMRNGDVSTQGNKNIDTAAQTIRKEVFDPLLKEAQELGIIPPDIQPKFAKSYVTRIWHRGKLLADPEGAKKMFRQWASEKINGQVAETKARIKKLESELPTAKNPAKLSEEIVELKQSISRMQNVGGDLNGFDEAIDDLADEIFQKLTSLGDNELPDFIVPLTRGVLKNKVLDIPDSVASPFLDNDIGTIINRYTQQMGSQIALTRKFGSADLRDQFKELADEFQSAVKSMKGDSKKITKLTKQYDSDVRDLQNMRDLLRGTFKKNKDPDGILSQAGTVLRDLQYMSKLGGVTISSLPDIFRNIMVNGITRAFPDAVSRLSMPKELRAMKLEELKEMGFAWETTLATRMSTLADVSDPLARGSALTRFSGEMSAGFSRVTMINAWNDLMKNWAATTTQRRILSNVENMSKGNLSKKETAYFAFLGIDKGTAGVIAQQFGKHGRKDGLIAGIKNWDDTKSVNHAARVFKGALRKEADTIIVTSGISDKPTIANTPVGALILQFKGFMFTANQRVLMRGLQDSDANTALGAVMMVAGGMITAAIKKAEKDLSAEITGDKKRGSIEDWSTAKWMQEGVDRSGLFSVAWEANNIWEKAGGYGVTQAFGMPPASRFQSRNIAGALFGPTIGTAADAGSAIGVANAAFTGRDIYKSDVKAIRRMIPFQNTIGFKFAFDAIQGEVAENAK